MRPRLALTEPGLNTNALHATLCLVEDELRRQLLASYPAAAGSPHAAMRVKHPQWQALLAQCPAHEALRRELPVTECTLPLRRTCRPLATGW